MTNLQKYLQDNPEAADVLRESGVLEVFQKADTLIEQLYGRVQDLREERDALLPGRSLDWDLEALDNGDGKATIIGRDEDGNELFWAREVYEGVWKPSISSRAYRSKELPFVCPTYADAMAVCDAIHDHANIPHGYR